MSVTRFTACNSIRSRLEHLWKARRCWRTSSADVDRETVETIVECRLPASQTSAHLEALPPASWTPSRLCTFTEVLFATTRRTGEAVARVIGALDCAGTGGSGLPHFNTSTTVAFVLAAGGLKVAKFGNRAALGTSGSFDLLEVWLFPRARHQKPCHSCWTKSVWHFFSPRSIIRVGQISTNSSNRSASAPFSIFLARCSIRCVLIIESWASLANLLSKP